MAYQPVTKDKVSTDNSSTAALNNAATFTGTWEDCSNYESVVVAVKTDQNGIFYIDFSPDGTNADSTLTKYYNTPDIEPPHRFTVTRKYFRVRFTNDSGSNQTYFRLQTALKTSSSQLNVPIDQAISRDYDSLSVRPTDFKYETALGLRQGATTWNKFGYNDDVDSAAAEVVASWGGAFTYLTSASTLTVVSASANDDDGGTGVNSIVIYGVDANWETQIEVVTLNGTTPVVTSTTWLGINRASIYLAGSGQTNAGAIAITATTGGSTQAQIPAGAGTSQQAIFFVDDNHTALSDHLLINVNKLAGGSAPRVTIKGWVFSAVSNAKYEVFRHLIDTSVENTVEIRPSQPFIIGEKSILWFEATTNTNDTQVSVRFSLIEEKNKDAD
jgi:hypothetical protein